jgi:hypothetical protein
VSNGVVKVENFARNYGVQFYIIDDIKVSFNFVNS